MSAMTLPFPPPVPEPIRRRAKGPRPSPRIALAGDVLAAMATMEATPTANRLAAALGWPPAKLTPILKSLDRSGLVDRWPDPDRLGETRVMLSALSLARLGLALAPRGDRWQLEPRVAG